MRVILDTNVLISGFLWYGPPTEILASLAKDQFRACCTPELLDEFKSTIRRAKFSERVIEAGYTADEIIETCEKLFCMVDTVEFLDPPPVKDPKDVMVLIAAYSAKASIIVSGDSHLLSVKSFAGIRIIKPAEFLNKYLTNPTTPTLP